jgi:hypothetical protein
MRTLALLAFKIQRFEVWTAVMIVLVVGISALIVRARLDGVGATVECFNAWLSQGPSTLGPCEGPVQEFFRINQEEAAPVIATMQALPIVVGLILGVSLVAREIEAGTASTVWALAGARRRWLFSRLMPMLALLIGLLAFSAVTSEILALGRSPYLAGGVTFDDVGEHGPGVIARGLASFGLAVTVGAIYGRTGPAMILSAMLGVGLWLGGEAGFTAWLNAAAKEIVVPPYEYQVYGYGGRLVNAYWRTPDGRRLSDGDAYALVPRDADSDAWLAENLEYVAIGVPPSDYPVWAATETIAFGVVGFLALAPTFPIVERRRPS